MEANNNATLEALEAINCIDTRGLKYLLCELVEADIFDGGLISKTISAAERAKRALSKSWRNCDIGTPEEQNERFLDSTEYDSYLKDGAIAAFRWGQKEYKAKQ